MTLCRRTDRHFDRFVVLISWIEVTDHCDLKSYWLVLKIPNFQQIIFGMISYKSLSFGIGKMEYWHVCSGCVN